jgi:iron(III) transport system substrate-binding protein
MKHFNFVLLLLIALLAACQVSGEGTTAVASPEPQADPEADPQPEAEADPEADPVADPQPEAEADPEAVTQTEGEEAGGELIIYSGRADTLVQPIIDQFVEATGINVEVRYGSTPELASVLLEEGENSPADVFYAQDPGGLGAIQTAGLLQPLEVEILENVPARFAADDGTWVGISGRARAIVYNTNAISDPATQLPQDLWGYTEPEWDGRIGWAPTNGSFQAMVTAMRTTWGEEQTREWLQGIQANNPIVFDGNTAIVEAAANGDIDVGFVNHYYLYRFLSEQGESFPARNYFLPDGGPGSLIMVSGAGILQSAENVENAEAFIEFLLSETGQQYFADQTFEYPVIEGVASQVTPTLAELDETALDISLADLADLEGTLAMLIDLGIIE